VIITLRYTVPLIPDHSTVMELITELVKKWNLIWFLNIK